MIHKGGKQMAKINNIALVPIALAVALFAQTALALALTG